MMNYARNGWHSPALSKNEVYMESTLMRKLHIISRSSQPF